MNRTPLTTLHTHHGDRRVFPRPKRVGSTGSAVQRFAAVPLTFVLAHLAVNNNPAAPQWINYPLPRLPLG